MLDVRSVFRLASTGAPLFKIPHRQTLALSHLGHNEIWTMGLGRAGNTQLTFLTIASAPDANAPHWSLAGKKIVRSRAQWLQRHVDGRFLMISSFAALR